MKLVQLNSISDKLYNLREYGNYPGKSTGFRALDPFYNIRKGNTTYITGLPTSGKTQLYLNLISNATSLNRWRHIVYSPETGTPEEIYAEIIHCLTGKSFNKNFYNYISESELNLAKDYVHDFFKVIDPEEGGCSLDDWYKLSEEIMKEFPIDTVGIDNWNDVEHDMSKHSGKISEYLKFQLPRFNRFAKYNNIHGYILVHPRNPDMKGKDKPTAPRPDEIEGGSLWYAKAQSILVVHRDWSEPDNRTTDIIIAKAKPKIVGKKGFTTLEFNPTFNCYYEIVDGVDYYPQTSFKINGKPKETTYEDKISTGLSIAPF